MAPRAAPTHGIPYPHLSPSLGQVLHSWVPGTLAGSSLHLNPVQRSPAQLEQRSAAAAQAKTDHLPLKQMRSVHAILSACSNVRMVLLRHRNILNRRIYLCSNCLIMALKQTFKKCYQKHNCIGWPEYTKTLTIYTNFSKSYFRWLASRAWLQWTLRLKTLKAFCHTFYNCVIIHFH